MQKTHAISTMSDLFMNMQRRRWHNHHATPPPTSPTLLSATSTASTTSADSSTASRSSARHINDHTFSHNNSTTDGSDTASNVSYSHLDGAKSKERRGEYGDDDDLIANILSLKLRKPKHWKWELSTSKSCSNIALPRILLYDHKGQLLVDAQDEGECVYRQDDYEKAKREKSKKRSHQQQQQSHRQQNPDHKPRHHQRSATTNLEHSIRKALESEFNGLQIHEATPSPERSTTWSNSSPNGRRAIEFNTSDLPDYSLARRSSSLRGVRFNVKDDDHTHSQIPEFLPTPPSTTTTPTSSSSGPREKRKYRRSHSSGRSSAHSESILERFSFQKGRFSSPEYAEEHQVHHGPRYFLRTSKAGTLVVQEDSFSQYPLRRRRRPLKNRSTESLQSMQKSLSNPSPTSPTQHKSVSNSPTPSEINRRKQYTIQRNLTDGNILLNKQSSASEEDVTVFAGQKQLMDNVNSRHLHKYAQTHNQTKDLDYSPDVHRNGKVR